MNGSKQRGDGYVRLDVPGGWPGDAVNQFEASGRTDVQNEAWNFMRTLLKWRKGNEVIAKGKMKHFMVNRGVYVYQRSLGGKQVVVMLNGTRQAVDLPLDRYEEILRGKTSAKDILSARTVSLGESVKLEPKGILVLEF